MKESYNHAEAERIRDKKVPDYRSCQYSCVTAASIYDHCGEIIPAFVECTHPEFRINNSECLGQCAFAGSPYGFKKQI